MTTSSPHTICWTGSSDTITISTLDTSTPGNVIFGSSYYYGDTVNTGNITISNGNIYTSNNSVSTVNISPITAEQVASFNWQPPVEWQDKFPEWDKVKKMCEEYPGLKIAFERFQTTYKLVVDHYDTPEDQRPRP
jgi:hypothetical protein